MSKIEPFHVGQRVWIESTPMFYQGERRIREYEIVEANTSSAYAVCIEDLGKENPYRKRINQKTRKIQERISIGYAYSLWETKQAFEESVKREEDTAKMRKQAIEKVRAMNLEQLQQFLGN